MPVSESVALEERSPSQSSALSPPPSSLQSRSSSPSRRGQWLSESRSPSPSRSRSRSGSWLPLSRQWSKSRSRSLEDSFRSPTEPPSPRRSSLEAEEVAETEEGAARDAAKLLYLFFCYEYGPIANCLYAVDVSDPIPFSEAKDRVDQTREPKTIYPILEFPYAEFPTDLCCVELDSKLYFLGGVFEPKPEERGRHDDPWDFRAACPRDIHVFDCATANATANRSSSEQLLKKCTRMNTGKPYPYVFVAYRKIYAMIAHLSSRDTQLSRFEVFDPDTNQWSILPDPPMNDRLGGHAVFDRKVFISTVGGNVFYFNVDKCEWVRLSNYGKFPWSFWCAEFIEDTLYACYYFTLAAFRPTSEAVPDAKAKGLFGHMASLTPEMEDAIHNHLPTPNPSFYLVHLGNRIFCYVFAGTIPDPNNFFHCGDSERLNVSLTFFEALKDTYTKFVPGGGEKTFFRANFLHSARFVACTGRCGACTDYSFLRASFSVSFEKEKKQDQVVKKSTTTMSDKSQ